MTRTPSGLLIPTGDALEALRRTNPVAYQKIMARQKRYAFKAHSQGQAAILNSKARFVVVRAGRRYGKTKVAARKLLRHALSNPGSVDWWVAPVYRNTRRGYREVLRQLPPNFLAKPAPPATANDLILQLKNGSRIEFYSSTNPDAMAGEGVGFVVVDEAALSPEIVWTQTIRPTLMDFGGGALLISTPRGRNWFWELARRGEDSTFPDYEAFHFTTSDNPYIEASEVEEARRTLPEVVFRQEILAEFIAGVASIFRFDDEAISHELADPRGQHVYMGVDLAKHEDFTVITASRMNDRRPVYHDRFNSLSWPVQREEIMQTADRLRTEMGASLVTIVVDATGVGDPISDDLELAGYDVLPIKFSNEWKNKAVKRLSADLEQGDAFILPEQIAEFEAYEYRLTEAGRFTYQAPEGGHDDEVSAKLLEHWGLAVETMGEAPVKTFELDERAAEEGAIVEEVPVEEVAPRSTAELLNDPAVWGR